MQLDYLLQSTLSHLKTEFEIIIVYHTTGDHHLGYEKLKKKYADNGKIKFVERTPHKITSLEKIFFSRNKKEAIAKQDNFKELLEDTLLKTTSEFVMFNTDDGVWLDDVYIDNKIFDLICHNGQSVSYRMYVGDNIEGFPDYVKQWGDEYLWDYYADKEIHHWSYPFAVDATVYHAKELLKILKNVDYHNPVTLEGNAVNYVMRKKLLGIGIGPQKSLLCGTKLNRVAVETLNPTIHISTDKLNKLFLQDYNLNLELPQKIDNSNVVPLKINVIKGNDQINIYEMDDLGRKVQDNLGKEGAKQQMK